MKRRSSWCRWREKLLVRHCDTHTVQLGSYGTTCRLPISPSLRKDSHSSFSDVPYCRTWPILAMMVGHYVTLLIKQCPRAIVNGTCKGYNSTGTVGTLSSQLIITRTSLFRAVTSHSFRQSWRGMQASFFASRDRLAWTQSVKALQVID
jgi:hypothetical protein